MWHTLHYVFVQLESCPMSYFILHIAHRYISLKYDIVVYICMLCYSDVKHTHRLLILTLNEMVKD